MRSKSPISKVLQYLSVDVGLLAGGVSTGLSAGFSSTVALTGADSHAAAAAAAAGVEAVGADTETCAGAGVGTSFGTAAGVVEVTVVVVSFDCCAVVGDGAVVALGYKDKEGKFLNYLFLQVHLKATSLLEIELLHVTEAQLLTCICSRFFLQ